MSLSKKALITAELAALLFLCGSAQAAAPPTACTAPQYAQFDFWLGEWEVSAADKLAGHNRIIKDLGSCVLYESWSGAGGVAGHSFSIYDNSRQRWHQTWVDNSGGLLLLDGGMVGASMVLEGTQAGEKPGTTTRERITWTPLSDGSVRQLWEYSADNGKTWAPRFDGHYRRQSDLRHPHQQ